MKISDEKHKIYLCYRQSQAEESMVCFIRDKLIRRGCNVVRDVTQSTTVLVLLTPGVFEFVDVPDDRVTAELFYVLRRQDEFRIVAIICDLFEWPATAHLPEEIALLRYCETLEWSPNSRHAFMKRLLESFGLTPLNVLESLPPYNTNRKPLLFHENAAEGRNGVSTQAQQEEKGSEESLRRRGDAFYFDELNQHVERKSPENREAKPAKLQVRSRSFIEDSSDDSLFENVEYKMEARESPKAPNSHNSSTVLANDKIIYKPPPLPNGEGYSSDSPNAESNVPNGRVNDRQESDGPDTLKLRDRQNSGEYEPPELPDYDDVQSSDRNLKNGTLSSAGRTATIKAKVANRTSVYVPPPTPPPLNSIDNDIGEEETDRKLQKESSQKSEPRSGTTTVSLDPSAGSSGIQHQPDQESRRTSRRGRSRSDASKSETPVVRRELEQRPQHRPQSAQYPQRAIHDDVRGGPRQQNFTQSSSRGSPNPPSGKNLARRKSLGALFHRKTFKLPKDSQIQYGRYPCEHPYWNNGIYRKFNLESEFCNDSYFSIQRNTLSRMSFRESRRNSVRREAPETNENRPETTKDTVKDSEEIQNRQAEEPVSSPQIRKPSTVILLEDCEVHRFVPEVETPLEKASEDGEARRKDAGSTPVGKRKTYEAVEEYPEEPRLLQEIVRPKTPVQEAEIHKPIEVSDEAKLEEYKPPILENSVATENDVEIPSGEEEYKPPEEPISNEVEVPYPTVPEEVPDYVVLPSPLGHIRVQHAESVENQRFEKIRPLEGQKTYEQQLCPPRRVPNLATTSDIKTYVPDVRIAAQWTQVDVRPEGTSETKVHEAQETQKNGNSSDGKTLILSEEKISKLAPVSHRRTEEVQSPELTTVLPEYQPPALPVDNHPDDQVVISTGKDAKVEFKTVPIVPRQLEIDVTITAQPRAHQKGPETEGIDKSLARKTFPRQSEVPEPFPRQRHSLEKTRSDLRKSTHDAEKKDTIDGNQQTKVYKKIPDVLPRSTKDTIVNNSEKIQKSNLESSKEQPVKPYQPPELPAQIEPIRKHPETLSQKLPSTQTAKSISDSEIEPEIVEEHFKVISPKSYKKPAIFREFAHSLFQHDDLYKPPPLPTEASPPAPEYKTSETRTPNEANYELVHLPDRSNLNYYPPPLPNSENSGELSSSGPEREKFSDKSPPIDDSYLEQKGAPRGFIRSPPSYTNVIGNFENIEGNNQGNEEQPQRRIEKQQDHSPNVELRPKKQPSLRRVPGDRRTRSTIEPAVSTTADLPRRRANSLDPRLSLELREYVARHKCDGKCCKVVCPRRLAQNIDNPHYADDFRVLTNLDVLERRRLSYLLAIESQRCVKFLNSKFISASRNDERSKTPDSGCEPNSKEAESDATLSDSDMVSEEVISRELEKIERMRRRNSQLHESLIIPPPRAFNKRGSFLVYDGGNDQNDSSEVPPSKQEIYRAPPPPQEFRENEQLNQNTYQPPNFPTEGLPDESSSALAAREALKNIIEGRTVFEPRKCDNQLDQQDRKNEADAYYIWHTIWDNEEVDAIPVLNGREILSLYGVMRHILSKKSSFPEIRNDLRTIIQNNGLGRRR